MGFVILAKKTGRPVVPICIVNLNKVYPPNSFWVYRHPIRAIVGIPMTLQEGESDIQFRDRVVAWFKQQGE
jgi:1-acyl-sn-glycerol-3-phosphate acyltransferase